MTVRRAFLFFIVSCALPAFGWKSAWLSKTPLATAEFRKLAGADFNGDGVTDVVSRTSTLSILLSLTQAGAMSTPVEIHRGDNLSDLAIGDVDDDGRIDVIATDTATNTILVLRANGDVTFAPPINTSLSFAPTYVEAGDFDEDGDLDLAITSYSAAIVTIFSGDGTGSFVETSRRAQAGTVYDTLAGDVDHDGHEDLVVINQLPAEFHVFFGIGDGTLTAPTILSASEPSSSAVRLADLDDDGDLEILSCEFRANTLTVLMNAGARAFDSAVAYVLVAPDPNKVGSPYDLVIGDFTDDGIPDVVVSLANERELATLEGRGDGTFEAPTYTYVPQTNYYNPAFPHFLVCADFTGDAQMDLLLSTGSVTKLMIFENVSGQSAVTLSLSPPTILVGQTVELSASVVSRDGSNRPTGGEVTFLDGASEIAHAPLVDGSATVAVDSLPSGLRSITASFEVPAHWRTSVSSARQVNVVTTPTVINLTSNPAGTVVYGQSITLDATATSGIPGSLDGYFRDYVDEVAGYWPTKDLTWTKFSGNVGTHTYYVEYEGDATHPPAKSNVLTIEVTKAPTSIYTNLPSVVLHGSTREFEAQLKGPGDSRIYSETLRLYEGNSLLATISTDSGWKTLPALSVGVHYLRLVFEGNQNYEASASEWIRVTVVPTDAFVLEVFAKGSTIYAYAWYNGSGSSTSSYYFKVLRRIGDGPWGYVSNLFNASFTETNAQPGTVYAFRVEARAWNTNQLLAESNVDLAVVTSFTDDPILPDTPMKAQHMTELVAAVNAVRDGAGLPVFTLDVQPGQPIRANDIESLRDALNDARFHFGALPVELSTWVAVGGLVRGEPVQTLRDSLH